MFWTVKTNIVSAEKGWDNDWLSPTIYVMLQTLTLLSQMLLMQRRLKYFKQICTDNFLKPFYDFKDFF